jgi:hypothetical protein
VPSTEPGKCQVFSDTVNIHSAKDLQQFEGLDCFRIDDHLFVQETEDVFDLSALSGLRSVSGYIGIADNANLQTAELPNLDEVGEGLVLEGNPELLSIEFDQLRIIEHYLHIFGNPSLETVDFPWLTTVVDDVIFAGLDALVSLQMPRLTTVFGRFIYQHSNALGCLCLPNLVHVDEDLIIHFNGALRSFSAPSLTTVLGDINFERNPDLAHLDLPRLETLRGAFVGLHNFELAQCVLDDITDGLSHLGGGTVFEANDATCERVTAAAVECPPCASGICPVTEPPEEPGDDVGVPEEDVGVPDVSPPEEDVGVPDVSPPDEDVDVPEEDVDVPEEDVDVPDEDVDVPEEDVGVPDEDVDVPEEDVGVPEEDVDVPDEDAGEPGDVCTRTQGYYRTHCEGDSRCRADSNAPWPLAGAETNTLACTSMTWLDALWAPPRGDARIILAKQYIAARLNVAAGADSSAIDDTLADAESLLADCDWSQSDRQMALQLKDTLDDYNNGIIGPGSCG